MEWLTRANNLKEAFTPAAPVRNQELFAGRQEQMVRLYDTMSAPGEHAAIFGERGVGKTSLATVMQAMANISEKIGIRVNCQFNDRIEDLWRRLGEALDRSIRVDQAQAHQFDDLAQVAPGAVALLTSPAVTTHDVLTAFEIVASVRPLVLFLDEFDRVGNSNVQTDLVDVMKTLSDHVLPVTIVVVGVSANVDALIDEHESIGRGLNEVQMPRMSVEELKDIVLLGLGQAEMTASEDAAKFIGQLSTGLPHYAHLMGLQSGLVAVGEERTEVSMHHVTEALPHAVTRAQQHVSRLYFDATHSTRENLFREVLLAAALTPTDDRGYFAPGDLREPLAAIVGRPMGIPAFSKHLTGFSEDRGPVLDRSGVTNRPRYRFTEPLLVPYLAMRGVQDGLIEPSIMKKLLAARSKG